MRFSRILVAALFLACSVTVRAEAAETVGYSYAYCTGSATAISCGNASSATAICNAVASGNCTIKASPGIIVGYYNASPTAEPTTLTFACGDNATSGVAPYFLNLGSPGTPLGGSQYVYFPGAGVHFSNLSCSITGTGSLNAGGIVIVYI